MQNQRGGSIENNQKNDSAENINKKNKNLNRPILITKNNKNHVEPQNYSLHMIKRNSSDKGVIFSDQSLTNNNLNKTDNNDNNKNDNDKEGQINEFYFKVKGNGKDK